MPTPVQCPTCFRVNPANAAYCYYDGRGLIEAARNGPLSLGTRPFSLPFSFSDGQGCTTYNQLVLACDRYWNEARSYLVNGTWKSFFSALGRADLAALAVRAASETDADVGLCHLLEGLPADAEALRPAKLALPSTVENLGALQPGNDYKIELVIENQGMLLLRGSIVTDCDWLAFGDRQRNASTKLFQTRDTYTVSVRVLGSKLRAGKQPLEGQIVLDTNGGRQTVAVRATVPICPFPKVQAGNGVLAGARSPREIAVKAKAHPAEAAILFEQGAVKAWYESNGWTYPIRGTQAKGKSALQQFFEALGLSKPPRLEINTERIVCQGEVGKRLTKKVIVRTAESKFVHAEAHSNRDWIKVLPAIPQGHNIAIPLRIDIPPCPGQTLQTNVTVLGNGQQRFVIPVALNVLAKTEEQQEETPARSYWLTWTLAGGAVFLGLVIALATIVQHRHANSVNPSSGETAGASEQLAAKVDRWWDDLHDTHLTASVAELKKAAGEERAIFELIEGKSETDRRQGYEQLAAKLPQLARKPEIRAVLGQFVMECCVYEPSGFNIEPLLRGVPHQFPVEDNAFPPRDKGEKVESAFFWLGVVCDTIVHKSAFPERGRSLAGELDNLFGVALDPAVPPREFKEEAEKALAEQCYRNLLPTAEQSIEQALAIRDVLIAKFGRRLKPAFRHQEDVKLLALGLSKDSTLWSKLEPIFQTCLDNKEANIRLSLLVLYEKANAELAAKMEVHLADKWKVAGNVELTQADKAAAIRERITAEAHAAQVSPAERVKQLQELLAKSPLSAGKPKGPPRTTPLQDSVRLAHASTMACLLFSKKTDVVRFDELIVRIPGREPDKVVEGKKIAEQPKPAGEKTFSYPGADTWTLNDAELTDKCEVDPRRGAYRKAYPARFQAGKIYILDMQSNDLTPYLRVETEAGRRLLDGRGANAHIVVSPAAEGLYRVVASSVEKKAVGRFTLKIAQQQQMRFGFPRPFDRRNLNPANRNPGNPPAALPAGEWKTGQWTPSDLVELGNKQSDVRIAAFKNLTRRLPDAPTYRDAQTMARYLLVSEAAPLELEEMTARLPILAKCRRLLEALADAIAAGDKLAQRRTELIVGGLLQKKTFALPPTRIGAPPAANCCCNAPWN